MEELLELHNVLLPETNYHDQGLGQSWEDIDRHIRKSLRLPQPTSPDFPDQQYTIRKRQLSESCKTPPLSTAPHQYHIKHAGGSQLENTRQRLKIIRTITCEENVQSYRHSLHKRTLTSDPHQTRTHSQTIHRPHEGGKLKEVKLNTVEVFEGSLIKSSKQKCKRSVHAMLRHSLIGKQNNPSPGCVGLNIIHEENHQLQQSLIILQQNNTEDMQWQGSPLRRYKSQSKREKLPVINLGTNAEIGINRTIHASNSKQKLPPYRPIFRSRSTEKQLHAKAEKDRAVISKKYKVFLNPRLYASKLRLTESTQAK